MSKSEYFEIQEVENFDGDNTMDPYMAMDFEFTFGVMDTEDKYESFLKQYDEIDDERFKGLVADSVTVPMKSLNLNKWFDDYLITFKDEPTLENFQENIGQVIDSDYDEPTKLVGEQLMVAIVEGLPNVGHDEYLQTKNGMAAQSLDSIYRIQGVGTVGFNFSSEDKAMEVAEAMYKKSCVKLNQLGENLDIDSNMLLEYPLHLIEYRLNDNGDYEAQLPLTKLIPIKDPNEITEY